MSSLKRRESRGSAVASTLAIAKLAVALSLMFVLTALATAAEPAPANLFPNSAFELGRQFWRLDKAGQTAAQLDINGEDSPDGAQSALITIDAIDSWGIQFGQPVEGGKVGKTYTFAAMAKSAADPVTVSLQIERSGSPYDRAARTENATLTKDHWTELHTTFTVTKPFSEGWFAYLACTQPKARFRATRFRLYEGPYVPFKEQRQQELAATGVALFDTGSKSAAPLAADALAGRQGWTAIPEDTTAHVFNGDAVVSNGRLALVLRSGAGGAEVYSIEPQGMVKRSTLCPATADQVSLSAVKILDNNPGNIAVQATFKDSAGKLLTMGYELKVGQVFVQVNPGDSVSAVRIQSPSRYAIMPDFFADDIVVDARSLPAGKAELPSENFLLQMLGDGQAIAMAVWTNRQEDIVASLSGQGESRQIESADIPCGKNNKVWLAILARPGIWHSHDIAASDAGKIVPLDWKAPIPAMWRVDWRREDQLADSWEMIVQRAGGDFVKQGMVGSLQTIPADRHRWTTVLGTFAYPCWIDSSGQASLQPLKSRVVRFAGPAILYPLGRAGATPLDAFTVTDIVRSTLGVGPCEYILDLEGQQSHYQGRATCANRDTLNPIYEKGQQKARKAEVERSLAEVIIFIRHIRSRIASYVDFGHDALAYLGEQKGKHTELTKELTELENLAKAIDARVAARRTQIKTPDEAAAMIEAYRQDGMNDEGPAALEKCKKFTAAIVEIGGNQDELVGECRLTVKILRQRAGLMMAADPRLAEIARELRARSQKVLRSPAGHEGAGH